ncbi:fimbrial assembly protein [Tamilnaduibacter salinus]|uniref:Fimbrial assembly protein n=1 Tax=Tamilnaduibacter salinus TaxID=1484056 RepID=A0A2A2I7L9_9GAMM|nr:PilN domain-containing protein [Tamilnaduibacter salinus]PAV27316.1 fimbrial assembly protein [Tamilnaduibacter salinus]
MRQVVNLYTEALRPRQQRLTARTALITMVGAVVLLAGGSVWLHWERAAQQTELDALSRQVSAAEQRVARLEKAVEANRPDPSLKEAASRLASQIDRRQRLLERIDAMVGTGGSQFSPYMEAMARRMPDAVWLTGFRIALDPVRITMKGATQQPGQVPVYLDRLRHEPVFSGRTFERFLMQRPGETTERGDGPVHFRIASSREQTEDDDDG